MEQRRVIRRTAGGWEGVEREGYVPGVETAVTRHTLIGKRKERADEPGPTNELRYFDVPPGKCSRLEKHAHEHWVIVGDGHGFAIVGDTVHAVARHDVVYVAPWEPHQFVNRGDEPFGFFCMVECLRDAPQVLSPEELARLEASPAGAYADPHGAPPPRTPAVASAAVSAAVSMTTER